MRIRQRLFLSNLLMLVIPIVACMLVSYAILFVFTKSSDDSLERSFPHAFGIIGEFQRTQNVDKLLESAAAFNKDFGHRRLYLVVVHNGRFLFPEDAETLLESGGALFPLMLSDGVSGDMSANNIHVFVEESGGYRILLVDMRRDSSTYQFFGRPTYRHVLFIFCLLLTMILLTNRILTHFLTKRIMEPLNLLVYGVHELRDGNLRYRIRYARRDEFAPVCDDFNEMAERLQELIERQQKDDTNRKELLAGISHDLRTPLTSIKAYVEGLLDGVAEDYPTQLKYLGIIRKRADDIDHIVDKLFLFSKLDLGEFPFYHQRLDIGEELSSLVGTVAEEYEKKGLALVLRHSLPGVEVYADPVQLRGALTNVLENSVNYKEKPHATLVIECRDRGNAVEIDLTDNGPGVAPADLDRLFDVFYRGDASRGNPGKGSGLGLAITARIMERMGGGIRAENAPQGGLRMILTVPKYTGKEPGVGTDTDH